jgi:Peptidase family M28/PA domain
MRRYIAIALVVLIGAIPAAAPGVQSERLLEHIKFLASDDMRGRGNGTPELERAADYIRQQFESAGLQPGWNGDWTQPFDVVAGLTIGSGNDFSIEASGMKLQLALGSSYYPLASTATESPSPASAALENVPLVFAGYGLSVPGQGGYDDYANLDVTGKAVLIFSHEPQEHDTKSRLNGARPMPQTTLQAKAAAARRQGARALLVVSDPTHRADDGNYRMFVQDPDAENVGLPVLRLRRDEMKPLIDAWALDAIAREIDRDLVPRSRPLPNATVRYTEQLSINRRTVRNIVGVLPGSDRERAAEAVVIGAHYDHVGIGGRRSAAPERTGEIHNGADDNASGTAAIIEMARDAVQARSRFARTLVFVAFAGEEQGLLGSEHYARNPAVPMPNTIAMLNLDMVGRSRGSVDVSGLETAPSLEADLKAAIQAAGPIAVRREGPGAGRSDDSSFIGRRVPAINFFTGFHGDYHRPTDDWEKVDVEGTKRVATLALELAARIAGRPSRPEFVAPR